jgi:tetratricopeptide (TPR) repeat protein
MKKLSIIPILFACLLGMGQEKKLKELRYSINTDEHAGRKPSLSNLELYANAARMQKDEISYEEALKKIISYYHVQKYWDPLFNIIQSKQGYNHRLDLDLLRLKLAVGLITKNDEFIEIAQLMLQAGLPAESLKVIDEGYKAGVLGTGAKPERNNRLRSLALKNLAYATTAQVSFEAQASKDKDADALANLGYAYVTASNYDIGIEMIENALKMDGMKFVDNAKLHLGMSYLQAGKKSSAIKILKTIKGKDGTYDLANCWLLLNEKVTL